MPPVTVTAAGANRGHLTRDIPEPQVLEEFVGVTVMSTKANVIRDHKPKQSLMLQEG